MSTISRSHSDETITKEVKAEISLLKAQLVDASTKLFVSPTALRVIMIAEISGEPFEELFQRLEFEKTGPGMFLVLTKTNPVQASI